MSRTIKRNLMLSERIGQKGDLIQHGINSYILCQDLQWDMLECLMIWTERNIPMRVQLYNIQRNGYYLSRMDDGSIWVDMEVADIPQIMEEPEPCNS